MCACLMKISNFPKPTNKESAWLGNLSLTFDDPKHSYLSEQTIQPFKWTKPTFLSPKNKLENNFFAKAHKLLNRFCLEMHEKREPGSNAAINLNI